MLNKKLDGLYLIILILALCHFACMGDVPIKNDYVGYQPVQLGDGWEISNPAAEGLDPIAIDAVYERLFSEDYYPNARSLLIVRNGMLVAEAYCRDSSDRDLIHNIQSATKSITSILMGLALDQGLIDSLNTPIYQIIPEVFDEDQQKREITIYHALTMQTGLGFFNNEHTQEFYNYEGNSLEYVLHKNLIFEPGSSFYYNDGNPQLISGIIEAASGLSLKHFAEEYLFDRLGIYDYQWETASDGLAFGAFGLWLKPRDMAKIGKLIVENGSWNGEQIVSLVWIDE